jgi:type II secretory ATPase GspE/PulE/Tfp pilus assembly ATPase PilB-like protein
MAQRLIRVLCKECKRWRTPRLDPKILRLVGITWRRRSARRMKAVGCDACNRTGYRGRKGIFEMMIMNAQIRELAFNLAPVSEIRKAAIASRA